jgi:hypothetical protein
MRKGTIHVRTFGLSLLVVESLSLLAVSREPAGENGRADGAQGKQRPKEYRKMMPAVAAGLTSRRWSAMELISYPLP